MRARFLVVALVALGLLVAAFLATTAVEGDRPPEIDPGVETRAADAGPDLPPEPSTPFAGGAQGRVEPPAGGIRAAREGENRLVEIRGRLVLRGEGSSPAGAVVTVRTDREEIDHPETVAALGGLAALAEVRESPDFEDRLEALGGWKPRHRSRADETGAFSIRLPPDHPRFRVEVEAEFAHYPGFEWFDLASPAVARGITLVLEPAGKLVGTLRRSGGETVAGGSVALAPRQQGFPRFFRRDDSTKSDADGRFVVGGLPPGPYEIAAIGPGCAPSIEREIEIRAGEASSLEITLPDEGVVSGRVVDGAGTGVEGAFVRVTPTERRTWGAVSRLPYGRTRSRSDGSFRIGSLEPGLHRVAASMPGAFHPKPEEARILPGGRVEGLRLVLEEGRTVEGRVVDAGGRSVEAALVTAQLDSRAFRRSGARERPRWERQRVRTASDGAFRLSGLGEGPILLQANLEGRGSARMEGVETGVEDLELVLSGVTAVAGRVVEADTGRAVRRFTVSATGGEAGPLEVLGYVESPGRSRGARTFATEDGTFAIDDLQPGLVDLRVSAEGFVPESVEGIEIEGGEVREDLEIRLRPGGTIRGTILDRASGTPVAEATVEAVAPTEAPGSQILFLETPFAPARTTSSAKSDEEGRFEVTGATPGTIRLRARHRDFLPATGEPIEVRPREVVEGIVLSVSRGGGVDGLAVHHDGTVFEGAIARAVPASGGVGKSAAVDGTGYFLLEGLPPGPVRVEVSHPSRGGGSDPRRLRGAVEVEEGKVARVELLPPSEGACTVRGRVRRGGVGVAGASITLRPTPEASAPGPAFRAPNRFTARAGEAGEYEIPGVPSGKASVSVQAPSEGSRTAASLAREIEVPDAGELVLDLDLPSGSIGGKVMRAADSKPHANAQVRLRPFDPVEDSRGWRPASASARTDAQGAYAIGDVPPGRYRVTASEEREFAFLGAAAADSDALAPATVAPVEVLDGEETVVDLSLGRGGVARVSVVGPEGKPVRGVWVRLEPASGDSEGDPGLPGTGANTDRRGVATLSGIPAGRFHAVVSQGDWPRTASEEGFVRVGEETPFRIDLEKGAKVAVLVSGEGERPIPNARVEFLDASGAAQPAWIRWTRGASEAAFVTSLRPGSYTLRVRAPGHREESIPFRIGPDSPEEIRVRLVREEK